MASKPTSQAPSPPRDRRRAAIYVRMSSRPQDSSIELQCERLQQDLQAGEAEAAREMPAADQAPRKKSVRRPLPDHLPRDEKVYAPTADACPACGGGLRPLEMSTPVSTSCSKLAT